MKSEKLTQMMYVALYVPDFIVSILVEVNISPTFIIRISWLVIVSKDFTRRFHIGHIIFG